MKKLLLEFGDHMHGFIRLLHRRGLAIERLFRIRGGFISNRRASSLHICADETKY